MLRPTAGALRSACHRPGRHLAAGRLTAANQTYAGDGGQRQQRAAGGAQCHRAPGPFERRHGEGGPYGHARRLPGLAAAALQQEPHGDRRAAGRREQDRRQHAPPRLGAASPSDRRATGAVARRDRGSRPGGPAQGPAPGLRRDAQRVDPPGAALLHQLQQQRVVRTRGEHDRERRAVGREAGRRRLQRPVRSRRWARASLDLGNRRLLPQCPQPRAARQLRPPGSGATGEVLHGEPSSLTLRRGQGLRSPRGPRRRPRLCRQRHHHDQGDKHPPAIAHDLPRGRRAKSCTLQVKRSTSI